jgi:hypothetical protein
MFRFAQVPDQVFLDILDSAIGFALDHLELLAALEEDWTEDFPDAARVFSVPLAQQTLSALKAGRRAPGLYELTAEQWLLLHDALRFLCTNHNGLYNPEKAGPVGRYEVGRIHFPALIERFFPLSAPDIQAIVQAGRAEPAAAHLWAAPENAALEAPEAEAPPAGTIIPEYPEGVKQHIE